MVDSHIVNPCAINKVRNSTEKCDKVREGQSAHATLV